MKTQSSGYILILSMFIISICVAFIAIILQQSFIFQSKSSFYVYKEKSKTLAIAAINLALDQVSFIKSQGEKSKESTNNAQVNAKESNQKAFGETEISGKSENKWLSKLLPIINKWQTIKLDINKDGIDGIIKIYVTCQQGKINLNSLREILLKPEEKSNEKKQNIEPTKENATEKNKINAQADKQKLNQKDYLDKINTLIQAKTQVGISNTLKDVNNILNRKLEDPTELFLATEFKKLSDRIFVPETEKKENIYIFDLFSVSSDSKKLNPWLLSKSTARVLDFDTPDFSDISDKLKPNMNWAKDWDNTLSSHYGKNFESIPKEISNNFDSAFEPNGFGIFIDATVGTVTQKVYAIVTLDSDLSTSGNKIFKLSKIYWI